MANAGDFEEQTAVVNRVDYAIVADANAPLAVAALQLLATCRARIRCKTLEPTENARNNLRRQLFEFSLGA
jgi:hypothetical protein